MPTIRCIYSCSIIVFALFAGPALAQLSEADIADLRAQGLAEGWTFTIGENDATAYALEDLCGLVEPPDWRKEAHFDPCVASRDLPAAYDWRNETGCPPIRNQGGCGSCWAFATVGALECNILIKDGLSMNLSEQWLVSCNRDGWSCDGGWFAHDYHEWKTDKCGRVGAVLEADFPYVGQDLSCNCPHDHPYLIENWSYIGSQYGIPTVSAMKQAILNYGPISVAIYAGSAFHGYDGGIFNACFNGTPNHAVVLVGWNDAEGCWIMRNSWGSNWGEGGYMRIAYGCSQIGYAACYVDYHYMDCNQNEIRDLCDVDCGSSGGDCDVPGCGGSLDCNANNVPDECDVALMDCNGNNTPDDCDIAGGTSTDCNDNGYPDECMSLEKDCNTNNAPDECDVLSGTSYDCNGNSIPDECEVSELDCNGNSIPDDCDVAGVTSADCNGNVIPDECEVAVLDCNDNGIPDDCDADHGDSDDCNGNHVPDECEPDCNHNGIADECDLVPAQYVEAADYGGDAQTICPNITYYGSTIGATNDGSSTCGDSNSAPDVWYYYKTDAYGGLTVSLCESSYDTVLSIHSGYPGTESNQLVCNDNYCGERSRVYMSLSPLADYWIRISGADGAVGDFVMILSGPACAYVDCNNNGVPDECEPDCNTNGRPDECDITQGFSTDADPDGIPDDCQILGDLNCDGSINSLDITPFVLALTDTVIYGVQNPDCLINNGDLNQDGSINSLDIDQFVDLLIGG